MREIKFRGVFTGCEKPIWMFGSLINKGSKYYIRTEIASYSIDPKSIGQYTGLKDRNGIDIYEGDIVKSDSGKIGYVTFLQQEMGYVVAWHNCDTRLGHRTRGGSYNMDNTLSVIGNIYTNPELIK